MANIKFSQLPNLGNITPTTIVPVVASSTNYTVTAANLQTYVNSTTGNITGGNVISTGIITAASTIAASGITVTGNAAAGNITATGTITAAVLSATGNVAGTYILGNGSQLTGLPATYGNADVAAYLPTYTGNLAGGNASITANITTGGIKTNNFYYANGTPISFAGTYGDSNVATYLPTYTGNLFPGNVTSTGNIQANYFFGNGSLLTGIVASTPNAYGVVSANGTSMVANTSNAVFTLTPGTNIAITGNATTRTATIAVSGTVANATYATSAGTATTATSATTAVSASTATTATTAGTVTSASQPAITSVGTLTSLTVSGNIAAGNVSGNGSAMTGIVTGLTAGTGISISASTGNVTITNTGAGGTPTSIVNGTSNVNIAAANGNVTVSVGGSTNQLSINSLQSTFSGIIANTGIQAKKLNIQNGANVSGVGAGELSSMDGGLQVLNGGITSTGNITVASPSTFIAGVQTKTGTSTGTQGQICWDTSYIYVCVGTNQWKRAALSSF